MENYSSDTIKKKLETLTIWRGNIDINVLTGGWTNDTYLVTDDKKKYVAKIGNNCIIGANALVTENKIIPNNSLVIGSPGKVVRKVTKKEIAHIKDNAKVYIKNWKKYLKSNI